MATVHIEALGENFCQVYHERYPKRRLPLWLPAFLPSYPASGNVSSEIKLVRVLLAHFMEIQQSSPSDFFSRIQGLRTCLLMCEQLGILVLSHDREHYAYNELEASIEEA